MQITGLPFRFLIEGDLTRAAATTLSVELSPAYSEEDFDQLRCVVAWFSDLGNWGALGGNVVDPALATALLAESEPTYGGTILVWTFDSLAVAPTAAVVLANLIYATHLPVISAALRTSGPNSDKTHECDDFPERWPRVPFDLVEDRTDRSVQIVVDFVGDLSEETSDKVGDALRQWVMVAALGGFRYPGPLSDRVDLSPETDPVIMLDQLTLSIRDDGLHDAAYDALVNLCAGMHARGVPIVRLETS